MAEAQLKERQERLAKMLKENVPAAEIVAALEDLKKQPSPTEEQIRTTKIGVTIGRLRGNTNKEIAKVAAEVVHRWRKSVDTEKKARANRTSAQGTASPSPTPAKIPASGGQPWSGSDPEKRSFQNDKVSLAGRTPSASRDNCAGLMYNGLCYRSTEPIEKVLGKAVEVEKAAYQAYDGETNDYKAKIRSLFQNLKNKSNRELGVKVMSGEIAPEKFVVMTHDELKSADQRDKEAALNKENMNKAQVPKAEKVVTDAFQCGKCKQRKVSYTQAQTRSADEPMTTFCECTVCGNRWKFS